jgi:predicted O-methyltransferase YrrM/mannosyltransferase OCH1-like enzyme
MDYQKIIGELDKLYETPINDGCIAQIPSQMEKLKEIIDVVNPKNILEIGFGLGKSSTFFLLNSNARVFSFDIFDQDYHKIGKKYIDDVFPSRHVLVQGNTLNTLDKFMTSENIKFDIIFIDGGRDDFPYSDLSKCAFLSDSNTILILNNVIRKEENYAFWNQGFNSAWDRMLEKKYITEIDQIDYFWGRGMATGFYNFDSNGKPLCNYSEYKNMNKKDLYNAACNAFSHNGPTKIFDIISNLYLSYFGKIDENDTRQIQFYDAVSKKNIDRDYSIQTLETLLNQGNKLDSNMKIPIEEQLKELYDKSPIDSIPKIIHLLFFGETDFQPYHYKCITSMIKAMPNYKVVIYNKVEPIGNAYWDCLKKFSVVNIEKIEPPITFDGFDLKHFQYKADVVRIEKLYEHGGIYLDIDMLIFKNFEKIFESGHDFYISRENYDGEGLINAFIASKPKNEFLKIWLDSFKTGLRMNVWAYHIRDSNAIILKENPHYYFKYNISVLNAEEFFSIGWSNVEMFATINNDTPRGEGVYGQHLFETILHHSLMENKFLNVPKPDPRFEESMILGISEHSKTSQMFCKINDYVDEVVVLSLKERPEKTKTIVDHLNSLGIKHTVILNKLHWMPCIGCFEAHIRAIKYAKKNGLKNIMILEDDAEIKSVESLNNLENNFPDNWDMLYFGGILTDYIFRLENWVRGTIWCNHAYIVNSKIFDVILDKFSKCNLAEYAQKKETIDHFYTKNINEEYNCFLHVDQPIIQKEGYSDLSKKVKWSNFNWDTFCLKNLSDL